MAAETDWLERADWEHRSPEFGGLRDHTAGNALFVAMEFAPHALVPDELWKLWLGLKPLRNILDVVEKHWLRYAALDWKHAPLSMAEDHEAATTLATWGAKLTWVSEFLLRVVAANSLGWMASPLVKFDLEGEIRVAFVAEDRSKPNRLPPEVVDQWPRCDERGQVFVVGQSMLGLVSGGQVPTTPIGQVIQRCLERDPARRFATLQELRDALRLAGGHRVSPPWLRPHRHVWEHLEEGIGNLVRGRSTKRCCGSRRPSSWTRSRLPPARSTTKRSSAASISTRLPRVQTRAFETARRRR